MSVSALGTVLGIWAHPDDEVYLSAGLMATARDAGQRVVCVTATLGEHGTGDPVSWPPARLAAVRAHEQRASLAVLGVTEHHVLGLPDGGCAEQGEAVVDRLAAIVAEVRPDTIVTFGPDGFTGHADHQAVSRWATAARKRAAPNARLLHPVLTHEFLARWQDVYDRIDVFLADGLPHAVPAAALSLDVLFDDALADRKLVALRAQATQTSGLVALLGEQTVRDWCATEGFIDARPVPDRTWASWRPAAARVPDYAVWDHQC
ncbi:PIG-L family deacetylase [Catellatospora sp. NPDC049133]|jgi:LmbE family N-acetylglucosaminyl deacetylase|uniref:PIG-L deacetylase family protein n=1 Tax=Catellatospora sp. NPDC049133 TaxID=3155499 RepID=UPI0033DBEB6D